MVCIPKTHNVLWLNNTNDYWFVLIYVKLEPARFCPCQLERG